MFSSDKQKSDEVVKKLAVGVALSALLGYIAGLLTAPKSGKETRDDIKHKAQETYTVADTQLRKLHTELTDLMDEVRDRIHSFRNSKEVEDALAKGQNAKDKTRQMLATLQDGEATDKDLQKAITDATKAIEHLRDFLRK
jgi:gas vesicle protein